MAAVLALVPKELLRLGRREVFALEHKVGINVLQIVLKCTLVTKHYVEGHLLPLPYAKSISFPVVKPFRLGGRPVELGQHLGRGQFRILLLGFGRLEAGTPLAAVRLPRTAVLPIASFRVLHLGVRRWQRFRRNFVLGSVRPRPHGVEANVEECAVFRLADQLDVLEPRLCRALHHGILRLSGRNGKGCVFRLTRLVVPDGYEVLLVKVLLAA
mmetsp:Transcript_19610/g.55159  ORF Transcript_19610/g.55159 Transcript_19610/m.55159 type:complete len:213 (-) Transcript_19610:2812-3450(-)